MKLKTERKAWIDIWYNYEKNYLNINFENKLEDPLQIDLFNESGGMEYSSKLANIKTEKMNKVVLPKLVSGPYFVRVTCEGYKKEEKFYVGKN